MIYTLFSSTSCSPLASSKVGVVVYKTSTNRFLDLWSEVEEKQGFTFFDGKKV